MNNRLSVPTHSGESFTWNRNVGSVDMSDLPDGYADQVWNDALDIGFMVRSHRTGKEMLFVMHEVEKDCENEVCALVFKAHGADVMIRVFND